MDGVSCTLCHQIQDSGLGKPETFSGSYSIDFTTETPDRLIYGPFPEPSETFMRNVVGFRPVEGPQMTDSGLCATCHTLFTPYVDASGEVQGQFAEQTLYLEWEHSAYGNDSVETVTCQQCHMPEADGGVVISSMGMGRRLPPRSPFGQHYFVGGNTTMLKVLKANGEALGLTASTSHLDATLDRTIDQLQSQTANLSIVDAKIKNGTMSVMINVESKVGHKFPGGFPSRRAWIHFKATDSDGRIVLESGAPMDDGRVSGVDADTDAAAYEPHYQEISDSAQVQVYEAIMQNTDGEVTYTLLRASTYAKDNRLLPQGFDKGSAGGDIAVFGTATSDPDFTGGSDQITYLTVVEGYSGPFTITAELLYQSISYQFVEDLKLSEAALVNRFSEYYKRSDKSPIVVASIQAVTE
jgi:hypothetical protein